MAEPVLIWGAGAIGATLGAYWARAGREVLLVDLAAEHVAACRESGLHIEGPVDSFSLVVDAVTPDELTGRFSRIPTSATSRACSSVRSASWRPRCSRIQPTSRSRHSSRTA